MKVVNCISRISLLDRNWVVCSKNEHYFCEYFYLVIFLLYFFDSLKGETSVVVFVEKQF